MRCQLLYTLRRCLAQVFTLAMLLGLAACIPTSARRNARLSEGASVALATGLLLRAEQTAGRAGNEEDEWEPTAQLELQYAKLASSGFGVAMQLKLAPAIPYSAFDLYFQLPNLLSKWYAGIGVEGSQLAPSVYLVMTRYLTSELYLSLTARHLWALDQGRVDETIYNPQLAVGWENNWDLSAFVSYSKVSGPGFNFGPDRDDTRYKLSRFFVFGLSARL